MNIVIVNDRAGECQGIYVDGVLKSESHSLIIEDVLEAVGLEYNRRALTDEQDALLSDLGHLPKKLELL